MQPIRSKMLLAATAAMLLCPIIAPAQHPDVLVDFGLAGNVTANPDTFGHYWNNMTSVALGGGIAGLVTTNNTATTIALTNINVSSLAANNTGVATTDPNRIGYFSVSSATIDFFYSASATGSNSFKIYGLSAANNYQLRFYGARDFNGSPSRTTAYTVMAGNGMFTTNLVTSGTSVGGTGTNYNCTIASLDGLKSDGNNELQVAFATISGGFSYLNIMEIIINRPPTAANDSTNRNAGSAITINTSSLLANDSDPDADSVQFVNFASFPDGTTTNATSITLAATNTDQTFTYVINDGLGLTATGTVSVVINKLTPTITSLPTASGISYGQSLAASTLSGGSASTAGSFAFTSPSTAPNAGTTNASITFTPDDTLTYFSVVTNVPVSVAMTAPTLTSPAASGLTLGLPLGACTLNGGAATNALNGVAVAGVFALENPASVPGLGLTNVNVIFTPADDLNYTSATGIVSVTVSAATANRSFLVDFGPGAGATGDNTASPDFLDQYWNNLDAPTNGGAIGNLITTNNISTPIGLYVISRFSGNNGGPSFGGLMNPSPALLSNLAVSNATKDFFFLAASDGFTPALSLTNLNPASTYTLRFFGSRATAAEMRVSTYSATGGNGSVSTNLTTSGPGVGNGGTYDGNDDTIVELAGVTPDANNQIQIGVAVGGGSFAYLNALQVNEAPVSVPPNQITGVTAGLDGSVTMNFTGVAGYNYRVQSTTNLAPAAWVDVATITIGGGGTASFTDTNAAATQKFYRTVYP